MNEKKCKATNKQRSQELSKGEMRLACSHKLSGWAAQQAVSSQPRASFSTASSWPDDTNSLQSGRGGQGSSGEPDARQQPAHLKRRPPHMKRADNMLHCSTRPTP